MFKDIDHRNTIRETRAHMTKTMRLVRKTLYKTIEFQILFKVFYLGILYFIIKFLVDAFLNTLNNFVTAIQLDKALNAIPIVSMFDFRVITVLLVTAFVFVYVYLVEKNGVIIITTEYYRNNFVSFFHTLFLSMRKTPRFIFRRIYEMRLIILLFIGLYIMWKTLDFFSLPDWIVSLFGWGLVFYGAWIFFSVLFRYTFTAYTTCLHPNESYKDFNNALPDKFLRKRTHVTIVFYAVFIIAVFLLLIFFALIAKALFFLSAHYPNMISALFAFFVSFTIVSILIVLSFLKTFKVAIMTVLYYQERKRQKLPIKTLPKEKQPILSKKLTYALLTLFAIVTIAGALLTTTVKNKTDIIINNAQEYLIQLQNEHAISEQELEKFKDMEPQELVLAILTHQPSSSSTIDIIEKFVFAFLAYLAIK